MIMSKVGVTKEDIQIMYDRALLKNVSGRGRKGFKTCSNHTYDLDTGEVG